MTNLEVILITILFFWFFINLIIYKSKYKLYKLLEKRTKINASLDKIYYFVLTSTEGIKTIEVDENTYYKFSTNDFIPAL